MISPDASIRVDAHELVEAHRLVRAVCDQVLLRDGLPLDHPMSQPAIEARYLCTELMRRMIKMVG